MEKIYIWKSSDQGCVQCIRTRHRTAVSHIQKYAGHPLTSISHFCLEYGVIIILLRLLRYVMKWADSSSCKSRPPPSDATWMRQRNKRERGGGGGGGGITQRRKASKGRSKNKNTKYEKSNQTRPKPTPVRHECRSRGLVREKSTKNLQERLACRGRTPWRQQVGANNDWWYMQLLRTN